MARYLFSSDLILTSVGVSVQLAANAPYTLWTQRAGGTQCTDCTAPDGVTPLPVDTQGSFLADGTGQRPALRGPDGVVQMWVDTGSNTRYAINAADLTHDSLIAAIPALQSGGTLGIVTRTAAQGVPTAADCAAAGYPDGTLITVDPA